MPTPDQIQVVTLEAAQQTPKGEPMNLQTLAERRLAAKAKMKEEAEEILAQ
jgi:hypothetical protein